MPELHGPTAEPRPVSLGGPAAEPIVTFGSAATLAATLAAIVECADDAIIGQDLSGTIRTWNAGAERLFGLSASEMVGQSVLRLVPTARHAEVQAVRARVVAGERVAPFLTERLNKAGEPLQLSICASPLRDAQGRTAGLAEIGRDVSAELKFRREAERLSRLYAALSQVNQAIVRTGHSRDQLFARVCAALVDLGGFGMAWIGWHDPQTERILPVASHGDSSGYLQRILVYADERPEGRGPTGTALREGRPVLTNDLWNAPSSAPWHAELKRADLRSAAVFPIRVGREVRATLSVYAAEQAFFQSREVALLAEAAADLSFALENQLREEARVSAERALRELNATLDRRVGERTAELQAALLRAEEADRLKSVFLATMSHELRTPLNSILGFTGILHQELAGPLTDEQRKQLGMVRACARHLLDLINDVLDLSKIEAQQLEVRREPFDLGAALGRVVALQRPLADKK